MVENAHCQHHQHIVYFAVVNEQLQKYAVFAPHLSHHPQTNHLLEQGQFGRYLQLGRVDLGLLDVVAKQKSEEGEAQRGGLDGIAGRFWAEELLLLGGGCLHDGLEFLLGVGEGFDDLPVVGEDHGVKLTIINEQNIVQFLRSQSQRWCESSSL